MILKNVDISRRTLLTWLFFFVAWAAYAQNTKFKRLSIDEGLSAVTVNTIFQDSKDFIWIGTQDGLNRYDGFHFTVFKNNLTNKSSIPSNDVKCIYEDKQGVIYLGTNGGGLSIYDRYTETFLNLSAGGEVNSLSNNVIRDIIEVNTTELLISTAKGINLYNKETRKIKQIFYNDPNVSFTKFFKDTSGTIWVGSDANYLFEFDVDHSKLINYELPKNFHVKDNTINSARKTVYDITQHHEDLICGSDGGLLFFNLKTKKYYKVFSLNEINRYNNRVNCLVNTADPNKIIYGTWGGLVNLNLKDFSYTIERKNDKSITSLSSDKISCILKDKQNNLWVGTEENGLSVFFNSLNKFPLYNASNGLTNDFVYSLIQLTNNNILVGTQNGLYSLNPVTNAVIDYNSLIKKHSINTVLSLLEDNRGNIWIGTYGQGIIVYNPTTKKDFKLLADKNMGGTVMKMTQDQNGTIWVGTYKDGLYAINPSTYAIQRYTTEQGLSSDNIYFVYENKDEHTLLLGTDGGGLCILDFKLNIDKPIISTYKHTENTNSISSNSINSIYRDVNGIYWIATSNGLNRFDLNKKKFTVFSENEGLPNSYIYAVIPDKHDNLWLPTNFGLTKFNPAAINKSGSAFVNYNTNDGLQAREFNQGAFFLCSDGKILVGGIAGLNYFDPISIKESKTTPISYIHSMYRQGTRVVTDTNIAYKTHLELNYKENYFTFELIALDYVSVEKNKFMYYLEGYDKHWSSPTSVRIASYTELPGGDYVFKVKATNSDGVWSEKHTQLKIKVIPPWWRTTSFYLLSVTLLTASVFVFIRYRTRSIKKENKRLENKVEERTKELAEKNRDITSSIEYAKRIQEAILPSKELIFSNLKNSFIFYKPKDIVSGDFYWFGEKNNYKIIAVVDCTGHGVPGAFMSMIGHNLLNQIVSEKGISDPGQILEELHKGVQAALKQGKNDVDTNDGMDVSLLAIDTATRKCLWAGAFRTLVVVTAASKLHKIEGNKYPVGGAQLDTERRFTTHTLQLNENDMLYMSTDGYADQFGGPKEKKFMVKQFHNTLLAMQHCSVAQQQQQLETQFSHWKGNLEQVDDVLVIGIKV